MKIIIPQNFEFRYTPPEAQKDILALTNKYNWSEDEKQKLMDILTSVRKYGSAFICKQIQLLPNEMMPAIINHINQ